MPHLDYNSPAYKHKLIARLISKRHITESGCWEYIGAKAGSATLKKRYGYATAFGKVGYVHRTSWRLFKGDIPQGMRVLHFCDNPPCFNPDHLWIGTCKDNSQDMSRKGRAARHNFPIRRGADATGVKLTADQVLQIRSLFESGSAKWDLARKFNVSWGAINLILIRKNWAWL